MPLFPSSLDAPRKGRTTPPLWSGVVLIAAAATACLVVVVLAFALLTSVL